MDEREKRIRKERKEVWDEIWKTSTCAAGIDDKDHLLAVIDGLRSMDDTLRAELEKAESRLAAIEKENIELKYKLDILIFRDNAVKSFFNGYDNQRLNKTKK